MLGFFRSRKKKKAERRAKVVMASSTFLQVLYLYAGQPRHFEQWFGHRIADEDRRELYSHIYERLFAWLCFFGIPAGIVKVILRENLSDYGLKLGKVWNGLPILGLGLPLATAGAWYAAGQKDFQAEYPMSEAARKKASDFFLYELSNTQYYVGWEFFYRGFMQYGLEEAYGRTAATGYQTVASTLMHIGKPRDETVGAIFGGPLFAWMRNATDSVLYPLIVHWWLGFATDIFCLIRSGAPAASELPFVQQKAPRPVQRKAAAPVIELKATPLRSTARPAASPAASKVQAKAAPAKKARKKVAKKKPGPKSGK